MDKKEGIGLPSSLINEAIGSMDTNVEDSQKAVNVSSDVQNSDINRLPEATSFLTPLSPYPNALYPDHPRI